MRILVCGGRDFGNYKKYPQLSTEWKRKKSESAFIWRELTRYTQHLSESLIIISGCATGADENAQAWAKASGHGRMLFRAEWDKYGNAAGPIRNKQMMVNGKPEIVIAFPGGKGTKNMLSIARKNKLQIIRLIWTGKPIPGIHEKREDDDGQSVSAK